MSKPFMILALTLEFSETIYDISTNTRVSEDAITLTEDLQPKNNFWIDKDFGRKSIKDLVIMTNYYRDELRYKHILIV